MIVIIIILILEINKLYKEIIDIARIFEYISLLKY